MTGRSQLPYILLWIVVPYLFGCYISPFILPYETFRGFISKYFGLDFLADRQATSSVVLDAKRTNQVPEPECRERFHRLIGFPAGDGEQKDPLEGLTFAMHRNGDPDECGVTNGDIKEALWQAYLSVGSLYGRDPCPHKLDKYRTEAIFTTAFHSLIDSCNSLEKDGVAEHGFYGFCDMGPERTPILLDHNKLVEIRAPNNTTKFLPCHFHTREGVRISSISQLVLMAQDPPAQVCQESVDSHQTCTLQDDSPMLHLYAVPAGRVFMFAPKYVGEIFQLPHVDGSDGLNIYLEVLSLSPRIFDVFNFFSREESKALVDRAMKETSETHKIKRSTTGAGGAANLNSRRTSESGFDTHGPTAVQVKRRCFKMLGFDEYIESHGDGLQILRYNLTTAYTSHLDWIEDPSRSLEHDFDSSRKGGNRFATILMYMSDLGEGDGGETVFTRAWPTDVPENERVDLKTAIEELRSSDKGHVLERGSWEEDLVAKCRTRLSIRPHSSRAVLFYSTLPNGQVDKESTHGACPILAGEKYAANLWVWNTPRQGYPGSPKKEVPGKRKTGRSQESKKAAASSPSQEYKKILAYFENSLKDPKMVNAKLYFKDRFWADLGDDGPDEKVGVNTYEGHVWNIKVGEEIVKSWTIREADGDVQYFKI